MKKPLILVSMVALAFAFPVIYATAAPMTEPAQVLPRPTDPPPKPDPSPPAPRPGPTDTGDPPPEAAPVPR